MRALPVLALVVLLALPLGAAHHDPLNCATFALGLFTPASAPVGCALPLACPATGIRCEYQIEFEVRVALGFGVVQGRALVNGAEVAGCGPAAMACSGAAGLTLRSGESATLTCQSATLTAVLGEVQVTCAPLALH